MVNIDFFLNVRDFEFGFNDPKHVLSIRSGSDSGPGSANLVTTILIFFLQGAHIIRHIQSKLLETIKKANEKRIWLKMEKLNLSKSSELIQLAISILIE